MYLNRENKTTIILTTHDISDIDALCKRIIIIDRGSLIYDGSIDRVKQLYGGYRTLKVNFENNHFLDSLKTDVEKKFNSSISIYKRDNNWLNIEIYKDKVEVLDVLNYVMNTGYIKDIKLEDIETEAIVKKVYERTLV